METTQLSVQVLKCPFGVREVQFMSGLDESGASALALGIDNHYAYMLDEANTSGEASQKNHRQNRNYAVAGTRGIQNLVAATRRANATGVTEEHRHLSDTLALTTSESRADIFSMHDKGRLLLWDSHNCSLVASHAFSPAFTVHQCIVTSDFIYTTLEGSPATVGAEEETNVYAWDRRTLQPVTVLRGHEGRLTALAITPARADSKTQPAFSSGVVLATASLDGTVRLWSHDYNAGQTGSSVIEEACTDRVQLLAVFLSGELGVIHSLRFLSADVLVAACSKSALAFMRLSAVTAKQNGANSVSDRRSLSVGCDSMKWQQLRSSVDPHGSTTTLHVCPFNTADNRKTSNTNNNNNGAANVRHASPSNATRKRKNIVTGSTSGYLQEWVIDLDNGDTLSPSSSPASPAGDDGSLASPLANAAHAAIAGVTVRGRWHYKAHTATVDCIVTDEDVVVSTSIFDGSRLYHRKTGATCMITTAAVVPVLAPQLKQLIWGSVDGSLSVASYALFASGAKKELQLLWTSKPHAAAIRGVCLSLTPSLQWKALCVGAADGSVSLWRSATPVVPPPQQPQQPKSKTVVPELNRVLDVYIALSSYAALPSTAVVAVTVVGLKKESNGYALAVAELHAGEDAPASLTVLPLASSQQVGDVTCARLCGGMENSYHKLCLVGTRGGQLLQYVKEASNGQWRALGPCKWTATNATRHASITAISSPRFATDGTALLAVSSQSVVGTSLTTQRILVSVLHAHLENGVLLTSKDTSARWEGAIDVPAPAQGSLTSVLSSSSEEPHTSLSWVTLLNKNSKASAAVTKRENGASAIVLCDSRGMVVRCRYGTESHSPVAVAVTAAVKEDVESTWAPPEALMKPSATLSKRAFAGIAPLLDDVKAVEVVVSESGESDITCVNLDTGRKRVLMKAATRHSDVGSVVCDTGTNAVRFAAVRLGSGRATLTDVSLYDDQGQEQYRVTRNGAVMPCATTSSSVALNAKKELSFAPLPAKASLRSSPARSTTTSSAVCTLLAASAADRLLFVGYEDGLVQMVDMTDMFVFMRVWAAGEVGTSRAIREVYYKKGVALVRLADDRLRVFVVPPRSILDQPMSLQ